MNTEIGIISGAFARLLASLIRRRFGIDHENW